MKLRSATTLFALALLAGGVRTESAQDEQAEDAWTFFAVKYDADGDGKVSRKEYTRDDAHWKNLDVDGNGSVDRAEFEGRGWQRGGRDRKRPKAPAEGAKAPDFKLERLPPPALAALDGEKRPKPVLVRLSSFKGKRPVALIFGSYT